MNIIILASGRGSRLNILTKENPKCLTKITNDKTLLDFIYENISKHENIIVSTGYKSKKIENHLKNKKITFVKNKYYSKTNMVESLMLSKKKLLKGDILIIYSDIFFDKKIINLVRKKKGNVIPVNSNWLKSWKKRYKTISKIKKDAENLIVANGKIQSIGTKIENKLPKFQYMGIIKIDQKTFKNLEKFYRSLNNKKISLTEFINESIKSKISEFKYLKMKYYWFEVDNYYDLKYLKQSIKLARSI
tara:strand:- start:1403 stop:2143 length:741 start_codon:yes stop_codon:yes gene_type:complete